MAQIERSAFGAETTTDEVLEGIDLSGRKALVTGASGGLGAETARALASKGAAVVLTARNLERAGQVAKDIRASTGNDAVEVEELELGSGASIRAFAERVLAKHDSIQLLINNAGVMACPYAETEDGFELQFGSNHLGHFLMTGLLAPALTNGAPGRIVSLSSRGHHQSPVVFEDIAFKDREYDKWLSYGQSKTANILFAVELERRLAGRGIHAYAVHPGVIMTDLSRHMQQEDFEHIRARAAERGGTLSLKQAPAGAATSVYAATAPELEGQGGVYLEDCHVASVDDDDMALDGVKSYALDPEAAQRLWTMSEELVGQKFDL